MVYLVVWRCGANIFLVTYKQRRTKAITPSSLLLFQLVGFLPIVGNAGIVLFTLPLIPEVVYKKYADFFIFISCQCHCVFVTIAMLD